MKNGLVQLDDDPYTAIALSLFGGNYADAGDDATASKQWWGNYEIVDLTRRQRSETQYLLYSQPLITATLKRIEDAAMRDLAWMTASGYATFVRTRATMPGLNRVKLEVFVTVDDRLYTFKFEQRDKPMLLMGTGGDTGPAPGNQMMDGGEQMFDGGEPMTD